MVQDKSGGVVCRLMKSKNIPISAFVETEKSKQEKDGIPVYCLDDFLKGESPSSFNIILAVGKENRIHMQEELEKRSLFFYCISDILYCEMVREIAKIEVKKLSLVNKKRDSKKVVGYLATDYMGAKYPYERLVINKIEEAFYLELPWETYGISYIQSGKNENIAGYKQLVEAAYCPDKYLPKVDIIHTFNTVCDTDKFWCVSFETHVPRMYFKAAEEYYLHLIECMKRPNCIAMYPISEMAYKIQKHELQQHLSIEDVEVLMKKTKVLYPPQNILVTEEEFEVKHNARIPHFIFIGKTFFGKGGREIIKTLCELEHDYEFKLTLISAFKKDDFTNISEEEVIRYRKLVQEKSWIDYYETLPNKMVLEKCKIATVGLLPSVKETFGYAVLEMQAAGCPVVTTNIRAFPETNNEECGWVCKVPINEFGFCVAHEDWSELLRNELRKCFCDILEHPEKIREKGRKALKRIQRVHNPREYQKELYRSFRQY